MSRAYTMQIEITGSDPDKRQQIEDVLRENWIVDDCAVEDEVLTVAGDSQLTGGESEEEFTDRIAKAVWKANEGYCEVLVNATCLEDMPYDTHYRDEGDYARLVA